MTNPIPVQWNEKNVDAKKSGLIIIYNVIQKYR